MLSVGISSLAHTKLIFTDPVVTVNGSYYRLTRDLGHFARASVSLQIGDVDHLKERLIYELCHFDQLIIDRAVVQ